MEKEKKKYVNQSQKKYGYPTRSNPNNYREVTLVEVTEEEYYALMPEIWRIRKREQYHGCCRCPKNDLWKCDDDCVLCEYQASGNMRSLDTTIDSDEGGTTLGDMIPDEAKLIEDIVLDSIELERLMGCFRELNLDADRIVAFKLDGYSNRHVARTLGRKERTFSDQMRKVRTELDKLRE